MVMTWTSSVIVTFAQWIHYTSYSMPSAFAHMWSFFDTSFDKVYTISLLKLYRIASENLNESKTCASPVSGVYPPGRLEMISFVQ